MLARGTVPVNVALRKLWVSSEKKSLKTFMKCLPCIYWVCDALFYFQVGFDPPPHMRVPTIPPNLAGIPGGKP